MFDRELSPFQAFSNAVLGQEMSCGGSKVTSSNYSSVLVHLRSLVGPGVLLYSNDCVKSEGSSLHPKSKREASCCRPLQPTKVCQCDHVAFKTVPPELDLVSRRS
jgi:hypothetical protein